MVTRYTCRRAIAQVTVAMLAAGCSLAWATVRAVESTPDLASLPWVQIAIGVAIASWGGITATLGRYLAAQYEQARFYWKTEALKDGAVSVTVGAGSYMAGAWYGLSPMLLGLVLLLSGYLGVRILSGAADRLLAVVSQRGSASGGAE